MAKKPQPNDSEWDERTTHVGLYNYAVSYDLAARALQAAKVKSSHAARPVEFLQYHAIELYLKAFLRLHGVSARELAGSRYGHRLCCLSEKADQLGFDFFMDEDIQVLSMLINSDTVIRARYIYTGYFTIPTFDAVERTCTSLRETVRKAIRDSGTFVR